MRFEEWIRRQNTTECYPEQLAEGAWERAWDEACDESAKRIAELEAEVIELRSFRREADQMNDPREDEP